MDVKNQNLGSLEKVEKPSSSSFYTGVYKQPYFSRSWHYHPEFELLLITNGNGKRLVGDHAEDFTVNDLVLLGGLLPHAWISDPKYLQADSLEFCESIYIQFRKEIFGAYFIDVPELKGVRRILKLSARGIKVTGIHKQEIISLMREQPGLSPTEQLLSLIRILNLISLADYELLVSEDYLRSSINFKSNRMLKIQEYVMENYKKNITIKTCAQMSNMTVSSFCRLFRSETNDTFTFYLNNLRIDFAKKLLVNTEIAIKEIAYECGYNSVTYFNEQFKKIVGEAPFKYRNLQRNN